MFFASGHLSANGKRRFEWKQPKSQYAWNRWEPSVPTFAPYNDALLEAGENQFDMNHQLERRIPLGMSEHNLLIALNNGNVRSLLRFPQIGPKIAENILSFRKEEGYITSIDELVRVPLIGDKRFRVLTGRISNFFSKRLHALLRVSIDQDIKRSHLRPSVWPAPGLARIYLGSEAELTAEKQLCKNNGHHWKSCRIGEQCLCFHLTAESSYGWAKYIIKHLPRALRKVTHERSSAQTH